MVIAPLTMIITTHNRTHLLAPTLRRFAGLTKPAQLIVVDDGGTDDCERICASVRSILPQLEYIHIDHPGETNCCLARNVGLKAALFDEILVCEPEVLFMTDVIKQLLIARKYNARDLLFGGTWHADDELAEMSSNWKVHSTWITEFPYYSMINGASLHQVGGWDEGLPGPWAWDDVDLHERLRYTGVETSFVAGPEAHHQWHPSRIEPAIENEAYVRAKKLPDDLIANKGKSWGQRTPIA